MEAALANMAKDVAIPMQAESLRNPFEPTEESLQDGQQIFGQACTICHGARGRGDAELGQAMYPPAMDLTSPHAASWADAELFWIIQNGIRFTGMPAWKSRISEPDTWKLILFIRSLAKAIPSGGEVLGSKEEVRPSDPASYGRLLYRQEGCFMCHQLDGEGGTLGPDLSIEGTRNRSDDWLIGHFQNPPAYTKGSIMPSFRNLTPDRLQALVAFLQSQKEPVSAGGGVRRRSEGRP